MAASSGRRLRGRENCTPVLPGSATSAALGVSDWSTSRQRPISGGRSRRDIAGDGVNDGQDYFEIAFVVEVAVELLRLDPGVAGELCLLEMNICLGAGVFSGKDAYFLTAVFFFFDDVGGEDDAFGIVVAEYAVFVFAEDECVCADFFFEFSLGGGVVTLAFFDAALGKLPGVADAGLLDDEPAAICAADHDGGAATKRAGGMRDAGARRMHRDDMPS